MLIPNQQDPFTRTDDRARWAALEKKVHQSKAVEAVETFRSQGLEPIVIKGVAARRYYPDDEPRASVDIDLAFSRGEFKKAQELLSRSKPQISVDLHCELRHFDTVPWADLVANSVMLPMAGGSVRVLRAEDDLRVLCVHWLTDGGVYRERLLDIHYAVSRREPTFDWNRFLNVVSERRQRWLDCVLGLAALHLGLDLSDTPLRGAEDRLPRWLVSSVEKDWSSPIKPRPLESCLHDRKLFLAELRRRMKPNPVFATVDCEGSMDARTRVFYQLSNGLRRIPPSIRGIASTLRAGRE